MFTSAHILVTTSVTTAPHRVRSREQAPIPRPICSESKESKMCTPTSPRLSYDFSVGPIDKSSDSDRETTQMIDYTNQLIDEEESTDIATKRKKSMLLRSGLSPEFFEAEPSGRVS
ncbi:hypothetical protein Scep_026330 [Stephania cephalantha]|uniref:Uncharacterized protein n=1 Tax=Stephania cephalantha TaxID=152367 RepID=A0AAP0HSE8_9MAGN